MEGEYSAASRGEMEDELDDVATPLPNTSRSHHWDEHRWDVPREQPSGMEINAAIPLPSPSLLSKTKEHQRKRAADSHVSAAEQSTASCNSDQSETLRSRSNSRSSDQDDASASSSRSRSSTAGHVAPRSSISSARFSSVRDSLWQEATHVSHHVTHHAAHVKNSVCEATIHATVAAKADANKVLHDVKDGQDALGSIVKVVGRRNRRLDVVLHMCNTVGFAWAVRGTHAARDAVSARVASEPCHTQRVRRPCGARTCIACICWPSPRASARPSLLWRSVARSASDRRRLKCCRGASMKTCPSRSTCSSGGIVGHSRTPVSLQWLKPETSGVTLISTCD
jgi:hypothetical protein